MPQQLIMLSIFMAALGGMALVKPALLFSYPVAAGLLMLAFILPQAWQIEKTGQALDYDPPLTWFYMTLCMAMLLIGFVATARRRVVNTGKPHQSIETFLAAYRVDRLFKGSLALVFLGTIAWLLMMREAATMEPGAQWTGVITLYALLSSLVLFGASLSWLIYLFTRDRRSLVVAAAGFSLAVPTILFAARRELAFELVTSLLLGVYFVRGRSISRALIIPMVLIGGLYINQASAIRSYMKSNDSSVIGALASDEVTDLSSGVHTSEVRFAVSDIAQSQWSGEYAFFNPYWNTMVQLYYPAFIFGREAKDNMHINLDLYAESHVVKAENGSTHTGFSDSFIEFHYFGVFLFFGIAAILGYYWRRAREGDISAQFYYMVLLTEGMMTITESTSRFVGKAPFMFAIMAAVFWYARRRKPGAVATFGAAPLSPAAQLQRSRSRLQHDR